MPLQLKNFETVARTERYRILARAAIRHNIPSLWLGHHQDDQVENFLMRLTQSEHGIDNLPRAALGGMRHITTIPCCNDIFGAVDTDSYGSLEDSSVQQAHPGLTIVRPFLTYPKSRLIATCEKLGVRFFTDETNLEPTRTRRNAVRHLTANYGLPRALERAHLVKLQNKIRDKVLYSDEAKTHDDLWQRLRIRRFDIRSCLLSVEFPEDLDLTCEKLFGPVAILLKDLLDAVSPLPRGEMPLSTSTVHHLLTILAPGPNHARCMQSSAVTTAGVLIKAGFRTLQLCRAPLRRSEHADITKSFTAPSRQNSEEETSWTEWIFWDNRYWLRIRLKVTEDPGYYTVRAFTEADMASVKFRLQTVSSEGLQAFQDLLEDAAPGKVRFTLPVILKGAHIVAFPTLDITLPEKLGQTWQHQSPAAISWQVRVKHTTTILRAACARYNISPTNPTGVPSSVSNRTFASASWRMGKVDSAKKKHTNRIKLLHELRWLHELKNDMPAEEYERHVSVARQRYAR